MEMDPTSSLSLALYVLNNSSGKRASSLMTLAER